MKFKNSGGNYSGRGVVSANSPYARAMPTVSSKSHVPSALASIAIEDLKTTSSNSGSLPGENLPEHHFKKRYFAEQKSTSSRNGSPPPTSPS